jgi:hypothetical protein
VSVRLHPILSGEIQLRVMNPRRPRRGPAKLPRTLLGSLFRAAHWYPVPVFLVEHPSEGPFLIDVGYDSSIESDPTRTLGFLFGKIMMKHRLVEPSVPEELSAPASRRRRFSRAGAASSPRPREREQPVASGDVRRRPGRTRSGGSTARPRPLRQAAPRDYRDLAAGRLHRSRGPRRSRASAGPSTSSATDWCGWFRHPGTPPVTCRCCCGCATDTH